jgi:phosphoribosylformylglycinamidine (FGAM) synthase-like enzyme
VDRLSYATTACFKNRGDVIALLGPLIGDPGIGGSEYLSHIHGIVAGDAPKLNLVTEKSVQEACLEAIESGIVNSAHDISDGGMAVALAECCLQSDGMLGASVRFGNFRVRTDFLLFGESQSRIILSISSMNVGRLQDIA